MRKRVSLGRRVWGAGIAFLVVGFVVLLSAIACGQPDKQPDKQGTGADKSTNAPSTAADKSTNAPDIGANQYTNVPQRILQPEGYYVYNLVDIFLLDRGDGIELIGKTTAGEYVKVLITHPDQLPVTVDSTIEGTALIVKHFSLPIISMADRVELVVRSEEHAQLWRDAVSQRVSRWLSEKEQNSKPRDVLPRRQ